MRSSLLVVASLIAALALFYAADLLALEDLPSHPSAAQVDSGDEISAGDVEADRDAPQIAEAPGPPNPDPLAVLEEIATGPSDPESRREQFQAFMTDIVLLYEQVVAQLGPPQPEKASNYEFDENTDPRVERASRGFFEDMKAFFGEHDTQDADATYQAKRMKGMSSRIDQQFEDVAGLLRDFENKRSPKRDTELEERARRMREKRSP